jgi:hypothetical protein
MDLGLDEPGWLGELGGVGGQPAPPYGQAEGCPEDEVDLADGARRQRPAAPATPDTEMGIEAVKDVDRHLPNRGALDRNRTDDLRFTRAPL